MLRYKTQKSLLFFTRYFFVQRFKRKFVIGDHHQLICEALEKVLRGEITRLIINIAPRYGKTEVAVKNFIAHGLALNPAAKFIHLSYSDDLALDNSEEVKDIVKSVEYQELFPEVQIRQNTDSKKKWYTTEGGGVYATSAAGQVTGFGAGKVDDEAKDLEDFMWDEKEGFGGALIIDDPIKPEDADSELTRERVNLRFDSTIRNRVNSRKTPIILIMQRLHEHDLAGHLIANEPGKWTVLSLPSIKEDGTALWPFKHTIEELRELEAINEIVFERQHLQSPKPLKGRLYQKGFRTYRELPPGLTVTNNVIDTADEGADALCSICYKPTPSAIYVTDVYYTQDGMEVTEEQTALQLVTSGVDLSRIESNNGGRSFARNVERIVREKYENYSISFLWFHQTQNKQARIFTNSAAVQNMLYFPEGWETKWPKFHKALTGYMAEGKNKHDDAPDAATMVIEAETNIFEVAVG